MPGSWGLAATIVVPEGNDPDQNAAMAAFGAQVVVHGHDYQAAREHAEQLARQSGARVIGPYGPALVRGVATYARELFDAAGPLDAVFVPIGMGSGVCGLITVRDLLGLPTRIIGVVSTGAPAYALSVAAGKVVTTERADTIADGVATRSPSPEALGVIAAGVHEILQVDDDAVRHAIRLIYRCTHQVAEGAGALGLAGLLVRRSEYADADVAVVLSGGNISTPRLVEILSQPGDSESEASA
jgi:threonine dehydratase